MQNSIWFLMASCGPELVRVGGQRLDVRRVVDRVVQVAGQATTRRHPPVSPSDLGRQRNDAHSQVDGHRRVIHGSNSRMAVTMDSLLQSTSLSAASDTTGETFSCLQYRIATMGLR